MLNEVMAFLLSPVSKKVEGYLADNAQQILKPFTHTQPSDGLYLATLQTTSRTITPIEVTADDNRTLYAHKVRMNAHSYIKEADKKIIVYMPGNNPHVTDSLPNVEALLNDVLNNFRTTSDVTGICQHYRGRGDNRLNQEENFSNYPLFRDVKDQAALIQHLIEKEGYKPENIFVLGYSFGSIVAIWTIYYLICKVDKRYSNIKFFSDRGFGNLLNYRFIRPLLPNQESAHQKLAEKEMMPDRFLSSIVMKYLPDSFALSVKQDECIWMDIKLARELNEVGFFGRVFNLTANHTQSPHFSPRRALSLAMIHEIQPHHFISAMLNETTIHISFRLDLPFLADPQFKGYNLGNKDVIAFEAETHQIRHLDNDGTNKIQVLSDVLSRLILALHHYATTRSAEAVKSGLNAAHKRGTFDYGSIGCTAKQQVTMAVCLMNALANPKGPGFNVIKDLQRKDSALIKFCRFFSHLGSVDPHHSGELGDLFNNICELMDEYEKIITFNQWILSMDARRKERMLQSTIENNLADWFDVNDEPQQVLEEDQEWMALEETPITDEILRAQMRI